MLKHILAIFNILFITTMFAQSVSTIGGNGNHGYVDGAPETSQFDAPDQLTMDEEGNIYITDVRNEVIRKIGPDGEVSTYAGTGVQGTLDGPAETATFHGPRGICYDPLTKNLYVAEEGSDLIRKIDESGMVSTISAGPGYEDGPISSSRFSAPNHICVDRLGNLYVADFFNDLVRKIDFSTGLVSTIAGAGGAGYLDGEASISKLNWPRGVAVDNDLNVYVGDQENHRIRKISPDGIVSTYAGSGNEGHKNGPAEEAEFSGPKGISIDSEGNLYIGDRYNFVIRKIDTAKNVTTVAGVPGVRGYRDGDPNRALFDVPSFAFALDQYTLISSDWHNSTIRLIDLKEPTDVYDVEALSVIKIFPNPSDHLFEISSTAPIIQYQLLDKQMKLLESKRDLGLERLSLDLHDRPSGLFYLRVVVGEESYVKKIIKI